MSDRTELYYAEMEAARNSAATAFFEARPSLGTDVDRALFNAGFERAFALLWHGSRAVAETSAAPETETGLLYTPKCPICSKSGPCIHDGNL